MQTRQTQAQHNTNNLTRQTQAPHGHTPPMYLRGRRGEEEVGVDHVGAVVGRVLVAVEAGLGGQKDEVEDVAQLGPVGCLVFLFFWGGGLNGWWEDEEGGAFPFLLYR